MIELVNATKFKGGKCILHGITVSLARGRRYALVGRNGSGKSSLAKLMGGLWAPTTGVVKSSSHVRLRDVWRKSGFVYQGQFHDELLSVRENLLAIALMRKIDHDLFIETIRYCLTTLGQWLDLDDPVGRLSGGQRRLVEIVATMHSCSEFLILDEPTRNIDTVLKQRLFTYIREFVAIHDLTLVVCTHDEGEFRLADEYFQLADGEVVWSGSVLQARLHDLVAGGL